MGVTSIEWTDLSWPLFNGCKPKGPGCKNCYAERLIATRLRHQPKYKGLAVYTPDGPRWTGESRLWTPDLVMPLRLREHRRIFVADMGDLFYEANRDEDIDRVFAVMAICAMHETRPSHDFQVLTKRVRRARQYLSTSEEEMRRRIAPVAARMMEDADGWHDVVLDRMPWPLPNVWLGCSVEDQEHADLRVPALLETPAALRFVSYEPALGPVDFEPYIMPCPGDGDYGSHSGGCCEEWSRIDWVIVGGESGPGARAFDIDWARSVIKDCADAGIACFVKQLGARPWDSTKEIRIRFDPGVLFNPFARELVVAETGNTLDLRSKKGGDMAEWPEDLRVRQWPQPRAAPPEILARIRDSRIAQTEVA